MEEYLYWKNRVQIFSLMKNFLNQNIDREEFSNGIFTLRRTLREEMDDIHDKLKSELNLEKFQDFNPNLGVKKISNLVDSLYILCDFYDDYDDDSQNEIFYENVEESLLSFRQIFKQN